MRHIIIVLCLLAPMAVLSTAGQVWSEDMAVRIIYVSNMPEIEPRDGVGGLPELAGLLSHSRSTHKNVLFLHGGDSLAPSALSAFDRGSHMVDLLNGLEPSAMAVAKREFAFKEDELILRTYEAAFPMLSANIIDSTTDTNLEGLETSLIFEAGPYRIGVFALIDPEVLGDYRPDRIRVRDSGQALRETAEDLRAQGADLVILMTEVPIPGTEQILESGLVDMIFLADTDEDTIQPAKAGLYIKQGTDQGNAVVLDVSLAGEGTEFSWKHEAKLVSLKQYQPDVATSVQVQLYLARLSQIMDTGIGTTKTLLDTRRQSVRTGENAFGNMVADALRTHFGSDVALMNGGGIRGNRIYEPGYELTRRDIRRELPFRNRVVLLSVTGAQILEALENGFSRIEEVKGRFPHVSGMVVNYDPKAPVGQRVRSVSIAGKPLKKDEKYSLATLDYIYEGGDGYEVLKEGERLSSIGGGQLVWETVRIYLAGRDTVAPVVEGRLRPVSD